MYYIHSLFFSTKIQILKRISTKFFDCSIIHTLLVVSNNSSLLKRISDASK